MEERENEGKRKPAGKLTPSLYSSKCKKSSCSTRLHMGLYSAQVIKNMKIPSILMIHEGRNGEKEVKRVKKSQMQREIFAVGENFAPCKILVVPNFRTVVPNFAPLCSYAFLIFFYSSAPPFLLISDLQSVEYIKVQHLYRILIPLAHVLLPFCVRIGAFDRLSRFVLVQAF